MRKKIFMGMILLMMLSALAACKKNGKDDTPKGNPVNQLIVPSSDLSEQFALPNKGDTVAEIIIRDFGSIHVKFFEGDAPKAVENFITHSKDGYYDGVKFHRIIEDFMIQGGDPEGTGRGGESIWGQSFEDEFSLLHPYRGALCMANAGANTNGSQFFFVQSADTYTEEDLIRNGMLFDEEANKVYAEAGGTPWLYYRHTVFGQIYKGYDVLDAVAQVEKIDAEKGIPAVDVIIERIIISEYED